MGAGDLGTVTLITGSLPLTAQAATHATQVGR